MYNQHGKSNNLCKGDVDFDLLRGFAHAEVRHSFNAKLGFLSSRATLRQMSAALHKNWNGVVYNLLDALRQIFKGVLENKTDILDIASNKPAGPGFHFAELIAQRDQHYMEILRLFDDAIEAFPISAIGPATTKLATPVPIASPTRPPAISHTPGASSIDSLVLIYPSPPSAPPDIPPPNTIRRRPSPQAREEPSVKPESPNSLGKRGSDCEPKPVRRSKRLRTQSVAAVRAQLERGDGVVGKLRSSRSLPTSKGRR